MKDQIITNSHQPKGNRTCPKVFLWWSNLRTWTSLVWIIYPLSGLNLNSRHISISTCSITLGLEGQNTCSKALTKGNVVVRLLSINTRPILGLFPTKLSFSFKKKKNYYGSRILISTLFWTYTRDCLSLTQETVNPTEEVVSSDVYWSSK